MTEFNIRMEFNQHTLDEATIDGVLDACAAFHPSISRAASGLIELVLTIEAESLVDAVTWSTPFVAEGIFPSDLVLIEVMATATFDARSKWVPLPELVSVAQAATEIDRTSQTVLNAIADGRLQATEVGRIKVIPRAALETFKATLAKSA